MAYRMKAIMLQSLPAAENESFGQLFVISRSSSILDFSNRLEVTEQISKFGVNCMTSPTIRLLGALKTSTEEEKKAMHFLRIETWRGDRKSAIIIGWCEIASKTVGQTDEPSSSKVQNPGWKITTGLRVAPISDKPIPI
uniref:Uncharacterized protein n=1 Tax=Solanum lycopersicum TaxID=4081 RepID=A0A3Q7G804_SOLLC